MKECFEMDFKNVCKFDIDDLLFQIEEFMPKLKLWQMKNSVITGDNFRVLCKEIFNEDGVSIGYSINAKVMEDILYNYDLILRKNEISLTKSYLFDGDLIKEYYDVFYDGENVIRLCSYERDEKAFEYSEVGSCQNYSCMKESLIDVCDKFKNEDKQKVRVK